MLIIETKELNISEELKRKFDMICKFACVKYEYDLPIRKEYKESKKKDDDFEL